MNKPQIRSSVPHDALCVCTPAQWRLLQDCADKGWCRIWLRRTVARNADLRGWGFVVSNRFYISKEGKKLLEGKPITPS